jgi:hypothetical protein
MEYGASISTRKTGRSGSSWRALNVPCLDRVTRGIHVEQMLDERPAKL